MADGRTCLETQVFCRTAKADMSENIRCKLRDTTFSAQKRTSPSKRRLNDYPPWNKHSPRRPSQKETHLPTPVFQVRTVSFRECTLGNSNIIGFASFQTSGKPGLKEPDRETKLRYYVFHMQKKKSPSQKKSSVKNIPGLHHDGCKTPPWNKLFAHDSQVWSPVTSRSRDDGPIWEDFFFGGQTQLITLALGGGFKHFSCFYLGEMIRFECFFEVFLTYFSDGTKPPPG